jgi:hypothetical protein
MTKNVQPVVSVEVDFIKGEACPKVVAKKRMFPHKYHPSSIIANLPTRWQGQKQPLSQVRCKDKPIFLLTRTKGLNSTLLPVASVSLFLFKNDCPSFPACFLALAP